MGKIEGECRLRLSSSRGFPRNATGVIWDPYHGQPRGWTGPRAHLSVQWGQGSVSKDERVREGVLGEVQDLPQHLHVSILIIQIPSGSF